MKRGILLFFLGALTTMLFAVQRYDITENFQTPRFHPDKFFVWNNDGTQEWVHSGGTGFSWGGYSPIVTNAWSPIGYLYNANSLEHIRNAMCFVTGAESPGSYAYCQFDSPDSEGVNDSLIGLSSVTISFAVDGPEDKIGLMIRDAKGDWYYAHQQHGIFAQGTEITFHVDGFTWLKVSDAIAHRLNTHENIESGLGDIRNGAVVESPDLSYVTGGGILLHEGKESDKSLRVKSIEWMGKAPASLPQLVDPVNGSTLTTTGTTLKWNYDTDEDVTFNVYLGLEGQALALIAEHTTAQQTEALGLVDQSLYNWRVDVLSRSETIQGMTWSFEVKKEMPQYFKELQTKKVESSSYVKWTNLGPGMSGYCDEYWVHPTDPNFMYMNLDMGNCYYTEDNGLSWITIHDWDKDGEGSRPVWIDFSRQDPDFGYALDEKGKLMLTNDRGRTFNQVNDFSNKHSVIAVDPQNDKNWYIGAGQFWRVKFIHRSLQDYHGTQYRNTQYGHVRISKDGGKTWTKISKGFNENMDVAKIFVDPRNSQVVYMFTNYGFYKSNDGGYNWDLKGEGLPYNLPRDGDMYYNAETGEFNLYLLEQTNYEDDKNGSVITTGGVYKSTDGGESWNSILGNLPIDMSRITDYGATDKYYRALGYWFGIEKSAAQSRFPKKPSSTYTVFNRIVVSKVDPDEIYLSHNVKHDFAFGPGDIWRTVDGGHNWTVVGRNGTYWVEKKDKSYWESRNNPLGMNMNYAHMDHELRTHQMQAGTRFLLTQLNGDIMCGHEQQVFRSKDKGVSWNQIDDDETAPGSGYWVGRGGSNLPGEFINLETGMQRYLYCSGEHGLWISAPDGTKVKPDGVALEQLTGQSKEAYDATSPSSVAVLPTDTNTLFMLMMRQSHRGRVRKTSDGGRTWKNISYPIQSTSNESANIIRQKDLLIDKEETNTMYFTVPYSDWSPHTSTNWQRNGPDDFTKFGVYRSKDGGVNWQQANNGLPNSETGKISSYRLEMDPEDSKTLYASVNRTHDGLNGGLYKTVDGADNWTEMNIPSVIEGVNHLFVDRTNGNLYLSAGEYKGAKDKGGVWVSRDKGETWEKIFYMPYVKECYTSNVNPNMIVVNCGRASQIGNLNPGVYFSLDAGSTWTKANYQLGQPARIRSLRPDLRDDKVLWVALMGSGWYKGVIKDQVRADATNVYVYEDDEVSLDGSASSGNTLRYRWVAPPEIVLSSTTDAVVNFTAPGVEVETEFKIMLYVSNGTSTDSTQVRAIVRKKLRTASPEVVKTWVSVYPNPVSEVLHFLTQEKHGHLRVFDLNGKIVITQSLEANQELRVGNLKPGVYVYRLYGPNTMRVGKFVKQ